MGFPGGYGAGLEDEGAKGSALWGDEWDSDGLPGLYSVFYSSVSGWFSLQAIEALPKAARERCCARVRGSRGMTWRRGCTLPLRQA